LQTVEQIESYSKHAKTLHNLQNRTRPRYIAC